MKNDLYMQILNALEFETEPMGPVAIWSITGMQAIPLTLSCFELENLKLIRSKDAGWVITNAGRLTLAREQAAIA